MDYEKKYKQLHTLISDLYPFMSEYCKEKVEGFFPELKESKDDKMRKEIVSAINIYCSEYHRGAKVRDDMLTWVEKQGELVNSLSKGLDNAHERIDSLIQKNNELCVKLEKQDRQEQVYIRFGEIPIDEKSKIYQGEIEVGTENGVSVYPAFKTGEGDIVLGLSLPITKTTLYTQQHLIEYDNKPCYLVEGDYVGKDTDGQPLINNVSIIKKINTYRVKEKKQGEQEINEPDWCHHKVDLSDCSEEYRKAYYDGWNNCNQQHSQCNAEQKPAWSEDDERALGIAILALTKPYECDGKYDREFAINWLKSLKQRIVG